MISKEKINALVEWGDFLNSISENKDHDLFKETEFQNPWFIRRFTQTAMKGISKFLKRGPLEKLLNQYHFQDKSKNIGLILAGNVPLVGFHDILCVLLSGHRAVIKMSHQDRVLLPFLIDKLLGINKTFKKNITFVENRVICDAIIATGSDNSSRFFNYHYRHLPHIIRKNRTSIAIITGQESEDDLAKLGDDIFLYFGLGCRNVSKLYLPEDYDLNIFQNAFSGYSWFKKHQKYQNNYLYQKTTKNINNDTHFDGHFFIMDETSRIGSPISVIYFEYYKNLQEIDKTISQNTEKIQIIVSGLPNKAGHIQFGEAQFPEIDDFPDNLDTMRFLEGLSR